MADKEPGEGTMATPAPQIASPIPSGEHTVWADVSPLLEAACGGSCFFIYLFVFCYFIRHCDGSV